MICGVLLALGLIAVLVYVFLKSGLDQWTKRGVKGPKPQLLIGNFPSLITQKRHLVEEIDDVYRQYKEDEDFVGAFGMRTPQLIVLNPEIARRVYVNDFKNFRDNEASLWVDGSSDKLIGNNPFMLRGESWKERRQEITPAFTPNRIKAVFPITNEVCERLVQYIREKCVKPGPDGIDAKDLSLRYTCDVVGDCVLGLKAHSLTDNPTPILGKATDLFKLRPGLLMFMVVASLFPSIRNYYRTNFFTNKMQNFFVDLLASAFKLRRENPVDRTDFMNYILHLQENKNMSDEQAVSHTMTFLLDGLETSASVIANCLLQLGRDPIRQEKLRQEILSNLNEDNRIDFEKLQSLPYLDQCLHESIRLISPLLVSSKLCTEPCEWVNKNGTKVQIKVNDMVSIPVFSLHYDEQFYPEPQKFIPERFDPEQGGTKKFRDMGVFYPFGDGPRICLGMRFALTQTKSAIVELVRNFNVKVNPKTRTDNKLNPAALIGELSGGVWLDFEERTSEKSYEVGSEEK